MWGKGARTELGDASLRGGSQRALLQRLRHPLNLPDDLDIEAREADPDLGFVARTMVLCAPESTERRAALMGSTVWW